MINELKKRYVEKYGHRPVLNDDIHKLEDVLSISLPNDFKEILKFYDGSGFYFLELLDISQNNNKLSVLTETLRLRSSVNLELRYLVLAEPPESLIVLDSMDNGKVIWIDSYDIDSLNKNKFKCTPDIWPTFSSFFKYLLDEEDEEHIKGSV